jgi:hypothetical protein
MIDVTCCPECGDQLHYQDGAIDPEWSRPDFVYCSNDDCKLNDRGYDPAEACQGRFITVVNLR